MDHRVSSKYLLFYMVIFLLLLLLSGCSTGAKSEKAILEDLEKNESFFQRMELEITDYNVTKRQTVKENRTDTIWITVTASNEDIKCTMSYIMRYGLYNSGWILDEVKDDLSGEQEVAPLHGVNDDIIQDEISSYIGTGVFDTMEVISRATDLDPVSGVDSIFYFATKQHCYGRETMMVVENFYFDSNNCNFCAAADLHIYNRSVSLSYSADGLAGRTWYCNRYRYSDRFDAFPDKFVFLVNQFYYEDSGEYFNVNILRKRNTSFDIDNNEPVTRICDFLVSVSDNLKYLEQEEKWAFNLEGLNPYLYSETDSERFTKDDWFCFSLDEEGEGYIVESEQYS